MCLDKLSTINYTLIDLTLYDNPNVSLTKCKDCEILQTLNDSIICLCCGYMACKNHIKNHFMEDGVTCSFTGDLVTSESTTRFNCLKCTKPLPISNPILQDISDLFDAFVMLYKGCNQIKTDEFVPKLKGNTLEGISEYILSGKCKNIILLTGAGISVASGIPDFRSPKTGLYNNIAHFNLPYHEAIFDIDYLKVHPEPFFSLSKLLYPNNAFIPTPVHQFIKLLSDHGLLLRNYTQNIDTLERIAQVPLEKLVEAHGSLCTDGWCLKCTKKYTPSFIQSAVEKGEVPRCEVCQGIVKPDIVFWGDPLPSTFNHHMIQDFPKCDLLIVIGTSLKVNPIASVINILPPNTPRLLINLHSVGTVAEDSFTGLNGFQFTSDSNDVYWLGDCQLGVKELCKLLSWKL
ncbi:NAD(+)-dependent deacetylase [Tieghemostelium lacteum]|uniref:NAD(+)-dependent deacetylase n=1 Tax=Tieghemostelium lacteum TaxID=361077 RepID=A0A151ZJP7_TIELA|nr:NAD(+)-dependent deacetylase [Tieghemostelium lacteum]|eukprot:KYQ94147.1 NAD(+)-dependent deacetylase [Tieghemostelium lacteum]